MSGGVDSSVAAAILKNQGYNVIGVFMKLFVDKNSESARAARSVANKLKIPFYIINLEKEFKRAVVDYYIKERESGRTPNPCVVCNRDIKGEILMKKVIELKADYLATGHYSIIAKENVKIRIPNDKQKSKCQNPNVNLYTAKDKTKDQTYFLWRINRKNLSRTLFPIGDLEKSEVRSLAEKMGLPTAERKESQGICFIPDKNVTGFIQKNAKKLTNIGEIQDIEGNKIGQHKGLINYTIGQREGLGLGGPKAYYVINLDCEKNILVVGEEKDLYRKELVASGLNWLCEFENQKIQAKIRYGHPQENCILEYINADIVKVIFQNPQRAITPGQSIVFYSGEKVLGGGIIK